MECGCGRSPTGECIGWHKLSEEQYQEKLKEHEDKDTEEEQILFNSETALLNARYNELPRLYFPQRLCTAPHQSRNNRELTRAVELLKHKYGGGIEPHRLLSAPFNLLANVFTSLPRSQFTVKGFKMSTILSTKLQRLQRLGSLHNSQQPPRR